MRILLASASLMPEYGGPAYTVTSLAAALGNAGADVGVWSADGSATESPVVSSNPPFRRLTGCVCDALEKFNGADIIHDSGIWLAHNHALARIARERRIPRVVSTRGMLEPWALRYKGLKKKAAWLAYQRRDLECAALLHATADEEAENIRRLGLNAHIIVIPNGVSEPDVPSPDERAAARDADLDKRAVALFLGRLHPKKGIAMLLEAWACLRPASWRLDIAGPNESGYRAKLEQLKHQAGLDGDVHFLGACNAAQKRRAYARASLFVFPSLSENFGVVVAEALAHELPVLTTTGTPWSIIEQRGCGWRVAPTVAGLLEGLQRAIALGDERLRQIGANGPPLVSENFGWDRIGCEVLRAYETILRVR